MVDLVAVNGKIAPAAEAALPALDRAFLYGDGIFEVMVAFHKKIIALDQHLQRLHRSAEHLDFELPWKKAELAFELENLVESQEDAKLYVRLAVSRGSGLGLIPNNPTTPNKIIHLGPAARLPTDIYTHGLKLKRLKSTNTNRGANPKIGYYLPSILGLRRAQKDGYDDILWSNSEGEITEASTANVFFLSRRGDYVEFITPAVTCGLLPGVTRNTLMELLRQANIPVQEQVIYADEIPRFDEAFICSSVRGIVPIVGIDQHKMYSTRRNSVIQHISRLYSTWIESQVGLRVDLNTGEQVVR